MAETHLTAAQSTPGPWSATPFQTKAMKITNTCGCGIGIADDLQPERTIEIAFCLIHAAAPEMRDLLGDLVARFELNDDPQDWPAEIREAQALLERLGR